ncbi:MAG: S24 family peptidase, partial [Oscillospiraceae bacterium]
VINMASKIISEKLKSARILAGLSQRDVYTMLGMGQSTFSSWETGVSEPNVVSFLKLCEIYEINDISGYFLGSDKSGKSQISSRDRKVLAMLNTLNEHGLDAVMNCLTFEHSKYLDEKMLKRKNNMRRIPVFMQPAAAGLGNYLDDANAEELLLNAPPQADIGIRISGDSMEPLIRGDEIVFLKYQPSVEDGEIGIFCLNGDAFCKKLKYIEGTPYLVSLNQKYSPIKLSESDNIVTYGKVIF